MQINWLLVVVLFCLSLPGVFIAVPRLLKILLPQNGDDVRSRISYLAIAQTLIMVFLMSLAGAVLSLRTGLQATLLDDLLQGQSIIPLLQNTVIPVLFYTLGGLLVFLGLYYGVVESILDDCSFQAMRKLRLALGVEGCILYGGIVEEVLARWGLMNVISFFASLFIPQKSNFLMWMVILLSGLLYTLSQIPAYLAAGCQANRRFIYSLLLLTLWKAILFGGLFWQFGLVPAITGHIFFQAGWWFYDRV